MTPPKRLHIKTYGCQMNVYDSERMAAALGASGYVSAAGPEDADLVVLNTCHIREKAAEKMYSDIGRLREVQLARRAAGADMVVAVAGCVAQAEGAEIVRRAPTVGVVVGSQAYHRLPDMVARVARGGRAEVDTEFPAEDKFDHLPQPSLRRAPAAFLTVQEGCDKFCAFCVVPYTRGAEVSRPPARLIDEAQDLVARGVREITLLGQNVNAYAAEGWDLARLIAAMAAIPGLVRLRYTTSHPNDMADALIAAHRDVPALMPYLHLPVQSGSDRVLKAMNRRHTAAQYLALIDRIREARPDIALSGDFITGFPGEDETDFAATLDLARAVGYAHAFAFKYSPRPGTPAAGAAQVPEPVKAERLARLQEVLLASQAAHARACVGRVLDVLVERPGRNPGQVVGKSPYLQGVHFDGDAALIGTVVPVEITGTGSNSLAGRRIPA